jgi:hypothetical protein
VVEYAPAGIGTDVATLDVETDAIGGTFSVPLRGSMRAPRLQAEPRVIDAGEVASCEPPFTRTFTVRNLGDLATNVSIATTALPRGVRVLEGTLAVGAADSVRYTVEIDPSQLMPGTTRASFRITEPTCGWSDSVIVTVDLVPGDRLIITPDPVVARTLTVGERDTVRATITNAGVVDRTVVSLRIDPASTPWSMLASLDGARVPAGSSVDVDLVYAPVSSGDHVATLTLVDAAQCTTSMAVDLEGRAIEPRVAPTYALDLRLDEYTVGPEARLVIPIHWLSDIHEADIDSFSLSVLYSSLSFTADSVSMGTMPDVDVRAAVGKGGVDLKVVSSGTDCGKPGVLAYIHGTAHSAIPDSTGLTFAKVVLWATEAVNVNVDPGWIIVDACGPRSMIRIGAMASMRVMPPVPVRDVLSLELRSGSLDLVHIDLINSVGEVVRSFPPTYVGQGAGTWTYDVSDLAPGIYGVRCRSSWGPTQLISVPLVR